MTRTLWLGYDVYMSNETEKKEAVSFDKLIGKEVLSDEDIATAEAVLGTDECPNGCYDSDYLPECCGHKYGK